MSGPERHPIKTAARHWPWAGLFVLAVALAALSVPLLLLTAPAPRELPPPPGPPRTLTPLPPAALDEDWTPDDAPEPAGALALPPDTRAIAGRPGELDSLAAEPSADGSRDAAPGADATTETPDETHRALPGPADDTRTNPAARPIRPQSTGGAPLRPAPQSTSGPASSAPHRPARTPAERRERVRRYGGTGDTENAVEAGIAWLAAHQADDGTWDRFNFDKRCPRDDRCGGPAILRTEHSMHAGITGLVLLAFLGAGYTDRDGPYQEVVRRGIAALLEMQRADGGFSPTDGLASYNNAVATFALAEFYALTGEPRVIDPLCRAVAQLAASQQAGGGWDYPADPATGRNDTSITGWAAQALVAASAAGIEVPPAALIRAALHCARATQADGRVWYSDAGTGFKLTRDLRPEYRFGSAMTAVGMTCAQLLGYRADSGVLQRQAALLFADPPTASLARGEDKTQLHSEYYWYYGTVAMFQLGGEAWERWNHRLRDILLPLQDREKSAAGRKGHSFGSWQPYGKDWGRWGRMGGRVYSTALAVLTLEIYYRHTPAYLDEHVPLSGRDWREFLKSADERDTAAAILALGELRLEVGEPVLVGLLSGAPPVAGAAARRLVALDSPLGRVALELAAAGAAGPERAALEDALRRCRELEALPAASGRVREYDAVAGLGTAELDRAYAGMVVECRRGGALLGRLRVVQRYSQRPVALIEPAEALRDAPRAGDELLSSVGR